VPDFSGTPPLLLALQGFMYEVGKKLYLIYFKKVLPKIAGFFSKSSFAYDYLPHSVEQFPQTTAFTSILKNNGFKTAEFFPMTFETSILYIAQK
jgi:demethylmenaquinone methyltransferase/2-methoxy-6-polyprenyl-1,4-benzoquinol methylase